MNKNIKSNKPILITSLIYTIFRGLILYAVIAVFWKLGEGCPTCIGMFFFIPIMLLMGYLGIQIPVIAIITNKLLSRTQGGKRVAIWIHMWAQILFEILMIVSIPLITLGLIINNSVLIGIVFSIFAYTNAIIIFGTIISSGILLYLLLSDSDNNSNQIV